MTLDEIRKLDREFLTPAETAGVLGCSPQTVRVWARLRPEGLGFPVVRIGSRVKVPKAAFLRFIEGK